jgi:hypothetical protein
VNYRNGARRTLCAILDLAQDGVRRNQFLNLYGGVRRTLCAILDFAQDGVRRDQFLNLYGGARRTLCAITFLLCAFSFLRAGELKPETTAAFDRYVKATEEGLKKRIGRDDFLWIGQHPKEKSLVWLTQTIIVPQKTLDQGKEIEVTDGLLQDWVGSIFLEGATLERVRDMLLGFQDYKYFFKQQVIESRLVKHDGDHFDAFMRLSKKQVTPIVLNVQSSANYTALDPLRGSIYCRSTHIGEVQHPNRKSTFDKEQPAEDEYGYMWRLNLYWRFLQADGGVYTELELISLSREAVGLSPGRFLNGYQSFPQELAAGLMEGLRIAFPRLR